MQRSRLKNIVNKSKEFSNKQKLIGETPFDQFKNSLPEDLESYKGDNYRLEAAWKAYGSPKDYNEAVWLGLINPLVPGKMPSIGYNEETDEYEYLNTGKENEIVAKDIRVWDNDVIPLVKELKYGGYVRTFNEEKNCWTYSKNPQKGIESSEDNEQQVIEEFKQGGKPKFEEWYKLVPESKNDTITYNLRKAYEELPFEELEEFRKNPNKHLDGKYKTPEHMTYSPDGYGWFGSDQIGWTFYPSPEQRNKWSFEKYKEYWDLNEPNSTLNYNGQLYKVSPQAFKQGGQMNVIPEGALHARKNNMELAKEGEVTHKGIPVVDNEGEQQAEIERNEIIFTKDTTDKIECFYKKFKDDSTTSAEKDELAIKCGKFLVEQILENTDDKTGLIEEVKENMV